MIDKSINKVFKFTLAIAVCTMLSKSAFSQFTEQQIDYTKEITWGLNKNTNGGLIGGIILKMGVSRGNDVFQTYAIELSNVKHPKELSYRQASSFVWGKQNFLYSIRGQYGREKLLFKKAPQQGVQISMGAAGGPSIGIIAPYYIQYGEQNTYEQFDPEKHAFSKILGSGRLFQGLGESKLTVGGNFKGYLNFEFGAFKNNVAGLEIGAMLEAYAKEVVIMPTQDNRAIFPSAYFTLFWGTRK
jgi:hypothetical protein